MADHAPVLDAAEVERTPMFAITADQVDSRHGRDLVESALDQVSELGRGRLALPPERTAGDELQLVTDDPGASLDIVLALVRTRVWSVGLGIGDIRLPLPDSVRAASGTAFINAREAVEVAKKRSPRFA